VLLIHVDHDLAARPQKGHQAHKCGAHVWTVLKDSHAKHFVERFFPQGNFVYAGLQDVDTPGIAVIAEIRFHSIA
jgi:hypothetical protein